MQRLLLVAAALAVSEVATATDVAVCTDHGRFVIELADREAPKHVENFLRYVDMGFYTGTVFHRVIPGFVLQGGGLDRKLRGRPTLPPVSNESGNGLRNERGSVAAARSQDLDSATSQFFVNLSDNVTLDAIDDKPGRGYTVFGRVTEGIAIVDAIGSLPTGASGPLKSDVPMPLVVIQSIARVDERALAAIPVQGRDAALKQRITDAETAGDHGAELRWIGLYRAICGPAVPALAVSEARAALAENDRRRAAFVLEDYFATTPRGEPTYDDALALYRDAVPEKQQSATQPIPGCVPPVAPDVPDGGTSSPEQMVAGQTRVKAFVAAGQTYIDCVDHVADDRERVLETRNAAIVEHNRMVSEMERLANDFNVQIRAYRARVGSAPDAKARR
jgi:peptidyl-prolyl cis-trans isomerase A (cyclophilin A)/peptidyl-prolyl cis-trans isomerase B (cyclophilin B)